MRVGIQRPGIQRPGIQRRSHPDARYGRRLGIAVVAGVVMSLALVGSSQAGDEFRNKYGNQSDVRDCGDQDTITYHGPLKMWPPNHKLQDVLLSATDGGNDNGSDQTTLTVSVNVLDAVGGDGGPRHDPDFFYPAGPMASGNPTAQVPVQIRSERSGRGDGRTYTITAMAQFDGGRKSCTETFTVEVPHDMRGGADWR